MEPNELPVDLILSGGEMSNRYPWLGWVLAGLFILAILKWPKFVLGEQHSDSSDSRGDVSE